MKDLKKGLQKFSDILRKVCDKGDIDGYALIGGVAVSARARPRATKDVDFLVQADREYFTKESIQKILPKGFSFKIFKSDRLDPLNGVVRIYDEEGNELVDIIPVFWKWQDDVIKAAEQIEIFEGVSVPIAKIEDLVVLKLKAGGAQDMVDIEELLKATAVTDDFDKVRMLDLAKQAGVDKKLKKILG